MMSVAFELMTSLVSAYTTHVEARLREQGLGRPESLGSALDEGEAWLQATLEELLALPFDQQRRGPLEVFQESMRFPTGALAAAGVEVVARDPGAVTALPGDVFDLAPASSRQLGEEVWLAHLAWGAAKAQARDQPRRVGLLSNNLLDRSRIEGAVTRSGAELVVWDGGIVSTEGRLPGLVLADLSMPDAIATIDTLARAGVRVIAFGPHVDRTGLQDARQAGADQVLVRSVFFQKLADLVR